MKKILMVFGGIFALLLVLFGILAVKGLALDGESSTYADDSINAIATTWSAEALQHEPALRVKAATGAKLQHEAPHRRPALRSLSVQSKSGMLYSGILRNFTVCGSIWSHGWALDV